MANLKVGDIFQERYLILAVLGAGGMGSVYRARQVDADREVALKIPHHQRIENEADTARFFREFKILSKLSHPNIMTIYGLCLDEEEATPYAVCEYIDGESLLELVQNGPLDWKRAVRIAIQICQAMQAAHDQGILHRDLKPDNVILLEKPEPDFVKLIDFGLSRLFQELNESQKLTKSGEIVGTAYYLSPESLDQKVDHRSDIYSLACLLYELLSGKHLFEADSAVSVIYMHCKDNPEPRLLELDLKIPMSLLNVLAKALKKNPEKRQKSMQQFAAELEQVLEEAPQARRKTFQIKQSWLTFALCSAAIMLITMVVLAYKQHFQYYYPKQVASSHSLLQEKALSPRVLLLDATKLRKRGKFAESIKIYTKGLACSSNMAGTHPDWLYELHEGLALSLSETDQREAARSQFEKAYEVYSSPIAARRLQGARRYAGYLDKLNESEKAEACFKKTIQEYEAAGGLPSTPIITVYNGYAQFLYAHNRKSEAYKTAKLSLENAASMLSRWATPGSAEASWLIYKCLKKGPKESEARKVLKKTKEDLLASIDEIPAVSEMRHYAEYASENGFQDEAIEIFSLARKYANYLSTEDAADLREFCDQHLKVLNHYSKKEGPPLE
ncbi:MAG: serine/threonine-protein kinase [Candidatus Obscuribacterales bacterium]|nr:serine/threonine-protein kinase [Candidatus Obscuribacterales bacterium]